MHQDVAASAWELDIYFFSFLPNAAPHKKATAGTQYLTTFANHLIKLHCSCPWSPQIKEAHHLKFGPIQTAVLPKKAWNWYTKSGLDYDWPVVMWT